MKEKYNKPQSDVQEFDVLDIITTSAGETGGKAPADDNPIEWGN